MIRASWILAVVIAAGACGTHDNSAETDKASKDLRAAQSAVTAHREDLTSSVDDIERRKRALVTEQQQLADKEGAIAFKGQQLGSAQAAVADATASYRAAVTVRFAKLDAALAGLATRGDAKSTDATVGLKARRDRLASMIAAVPAPTDAGWAAFTKDIDTTFDGIERDLGAAK